MFIYTYNSRDADDVLFSYILPFLSRNVHARHDIIKYIGHSQINVSFQTFRNAKNGISRTKRGKCKHIKHEEKNI